MSALDYVNQLKDLKMYPEWECKNCGHVQEYDLEPGDEQDDEIEISCNECDEESRFTLHFEAELIPLEDY